MSKGIHVSTLIGLIIAVLILILFAPMLIRAAKAVWDQIGQALGFIRPLSSVEKAILCSYYRCKYGINDARTVDACEQDFPDYNKPAASCEYGGLACLADKLFPDGKICGIVAAAYPIEVNLESGEKYEISKEMSLLGEDGQPNCMCAFINSRKFGEGAAKGVHVECSFGYSAGCKYGIKDCYICPEYGGYGTFELLDDYKFIFLTSDLGKGESTGKCSFPSLAEYDVADNCYKSFSFDSKTNSKLYIVTGLMTSIFSDQNRDLIEKVVPSFFALKKGELSHSVYCELSSGGILAPDVCKGAFTIANLNDNGDVESVTGGLYYFKSRYGSSPPKMEVNMSCAPSQLYTLEGESGVIEVCNGKYKIHFNHQDDEFWENAVKIQIERVQRLGKPCNLACAELIAGGGACVLNSWNCRDSCVGEEIDAPDGDTWCKTNQNKNTCCCNISCIIPVTYTYYFEVSPPNAGEVCITTRYLTKCTSNVTSLTVTPRETITLQATPYSGYVFDGFGNDEAGIPRNYTNPVTFKAEASGIIFAYFKSQT